MGDVVLTTPVIRCAHEQLGAEVHVVVKKAFAGILAHNPHVHRVHEFEGDFDGLLTAIRAENVDMVIDLHNSLRSKRLRKALKCPNTGVVRKHSLQKWIFSEFRVNLLPDCHVVEKYFLAAGNFGIENDGAPCEIFLTDEEREKVAQRYQQINSTPWIAIVIGAAHAGKQTPLKKWMEIIPKLIHPVVLIGGPEDTEMAGALKEAFPSIVSTVGELSIRESAAVLEKASLVIANDTGMMHVASCFGKPILSLWGQTVPLFGMYPYKAGKASEMIEADPASRRKIAKLGNKRVGSDHDMNYLPADHIAILANKILNEESA